MVNVKTQIEEACKGHNLTLNFKKRIWIPPKTIENTYNEGNMHFRRYFWYCVLPTSKMVHARRWAGNESEKLQFLGIFYRGSSNPPQCSWFIVKQTKLFTAGVSIIKLNFRGVFLAIEANEKRKLCLILSHIWRRKIKGFFLTVSITIIYRNINQGVLFNVTPSY